MAKPSGLQPWGAPPTPHGYQGGDLRGVIEHLDTLVDLGINAIYFTPVFRSASNHRYHTHDYYQVDPLLGGNEALADLLDAAHGRGIRVVLDGVFNHASRGFFQFNDILENGPESAYLDWFTVEDWPLRPYGSKQPNYRCWWGNPALPKFNTNTPAVREFLWDVGRHWIEFGIDGWRLDVPGEIDDDAFWREFRRRVKAANPEAYIVGEVWGDADRWLQGDQFDAVMNYGVARAALGFFAAQTFDREYRPGGFHLHEMGARQFVREIERQTKRYPWPIVQTQLNLLDSHDTARFITQAGGDRSALALALLFLMTIPGAPCIYYGTEIGMAGGPDPDCRRAFPGTRPPGITISAIRPGGRLRCARRVQRCAGARSNASTPATMFAPSAGAPPMTRSSSRSMPGTKSAPSTSTWAICCPMGRRPICGAAARHAPARVLRGTLRNVTLPPRSAAVFGMR